MGEGMKKAQEVIRKFNEERDWEQFHTIENLAKGLTIEASEVLECFQWSTTDYDKEEVIEELADVQAYCIMLADKLGVDLEKIVLDKYKKNALKYPVDKAKGNSTKYTKL